MRSCIFASSALGASAGFCCYDGCNNAPTSCNDAGNWCSSPDTCGQCGGEWCGDSPSPGPPSPPPPSDLPVYCPTVDDLTIAYCDTGPNEDKPCPQLTDRGWTILGGGGVATKSAFNLLGGYVEYDIDLSNVDNGVNANIYTISPLFTGSEFNKENDYCDGAATGSDWCMELDWLEANGHCGGAATIHTIEGPGNDGCTAWGCRVSEHYGSSKFHMKIEYDASGSWTITRDGQVLSGWNPAPDSRAWNYMKQMHEERGTVIYSSEWTGWVPVDDCGTNPGDLYGSSFSISNLVVSGSVAQGPEPAKCQSPSPPSPSPPSPSPDSGVVEYCPDPSVDFQEEVESGAQGTVTWTNDGWSIRGQRRVSSKASFDFSGGGVTWDMDLDQAHNGVNNNFYVTYPYDDNCGINCYCDSGGNHDSQGRGCAELDFTENNGGCFQATTWHDDVNGGDGPGYGGNGGLGGGIVSCSAQYSADGSHVDINIGGNSNGGNGQTGVLQSKGAVIYSSQWVGWVPGNCGGGDLGSSVYAVKNLKITGRVVQGPEPRRCHPVTTPAPSPSPSSSCTGGSGGSNLELCIQACPSATFSDCIECCAGKFPSIELV